MQRIHGRLEAIRAISSGCMGSIKENRECITVQDTNLAAKKSLKGGRKLCRQYLPYRSGNSSGHIPEMEIGRLWLSIGIHRLFWGTVNRPSRRSAWNVGRCYTGRLFATTRLLRAKSFRHVTPSCKLFYCCDIYSILQRVARCSVTLKTLHHLSDANLTSVTLFFNF